MTADTTVKYFHSGMTSAPVLSGTAGALAAVLDACLVDGFGLVTLTSLAVASNVATATRSGGLSFEVGAVITIAGATPSSLNGEWKVATATGTTATFATSGISDQTATGTITAKMSPAGWAKTYSGTNKAAYKPSDVTATGCLLRVDDAGTTTARVVGYETMSDVDTGTGPFPTATQRSGGCYWSKSSTANSTARTWMLVADSKFFYFARANSAADGAAHELTVFGDIVPSKSGDAYSCVISGMASDVSGSVPSSTDNYWNSLAGSVSELYTPRSYTGLGSSMPMRKAFPALLAVSTNWVSGNLLSATPYPNPGDGGLYVVPHYVHENVGLNFRGASPGFYGVPQSVANGQFAARDSVNGVAGMTGKTLKALTCAQSTYGVAFFDITGPWR